uniref:Transposase n=1 Tax=Caenorhabditis tropicalis TaxID=1561998 RepID=A0A1I7U5N0_9PELO
MALRSSVPLPLVDTEPIRQAIKSCGLFSLLVAAEFSEESVEFIRRCHLTSARIDVHYERDGKDLMIVNYQNKSYSFVLTKAIRENMIGKML